jgi:hypothetical protein
MIYIILDPIFQVLNISYQHCYAAYVYNISNSPSVHTTRSASIVYLQMHRIDTDVVVRPEELLLIL